MNIRLWLRLFIFQLLSYSGIFLIILLVFDQIFPGFYWEQLITYELFGFKLIFVMIALLLTLSLLFASIFTVALSSPFEDVRARVNWLLLGKYNHPIFKQALKGGNWLDNQTQTLKDLNHLRNKIVQLSSDLQEYTAAPVFVGEDTKEEIIEHERQRIARELHDSVSQQLFASMMMISAVSERSQDENQQFSKAIQQIEQTLGNAQTEMRALLLHLRPVDLAQQSLHEGIQNLLAELNSKVPLEIIGNLEPVNLESGIEDHLFRIVQEALSNTMRHARAKNLIITLNQDDNSVYLKISDDGVGFDVQQGKSKGNYGLRNMEERVNNLGGSYKIISSPGQGTLIDIKIPVSLKEAF